MQDVRPSARIPSGAVLLAALVLVATPTAGQDARVEPREWRLSTAVGPVFALGKAGERWAHLIAEKSGGTLTVRVFPGATLAQRDPAREFVALRDGAADLAVGSSLFWSMQVGELNVVGLPWLVPDDKGLHALTTGTMKERLDGAIERAGVVPLALAALGHRDIALTGRTVTSPGDVAGLRIRVASLPPLTDLFVALGALPRATSFADAQAAFRDATLEAQEGTPDAFAAARLDVLGLRHVLRWGAVAEIAVFAVNRGVWNGWSEAQRARVNDAAQQAARELPALAQAENDAALAALRRRGIIVSRLTAAGHGAFAAATRGVYDKWAAVAGADLVRDAEMAIAATRR